MVILIGDFYWRKYSFDCCCWFFVDCSMIFSFFIWFNLLYCMGDEVKCGIVKSFLNVVIEIVYFFG